MYDLPVPISKIGDMQQTGKIMQKICLPNSNDLKCICQEPVMVNLQNNASKLIRIIFVVVHRILTALNICEGFTEQSLLHLTCTIQFLKLPIHTLF